MKKRFANDKVPGLNPREERKGLTSSCHMHLCFVDETLKKKGESEKGGYILALLI